MQLLNCTFSSVVIWKAVGITGICWQNALLMISKSWTYCDIRPWCLKIIDGLETFYEQTQRCSNQNLVSLLFDFLLEAEQEILQSAWNNICRNNFVLISEGWVGFAESSGRTGRVTQNLFCCLSFNKYYIFFLFFCLLHTCCCIHFS